MGLFGKKVDNKMATAFFYDGEVPGLISDVSCNIVLDEDKLKFEQKKSKTEILLHCDKLIDMEILDEKMFMEKYKGNSCKKSGPKKTYFVFNYYGKDNNRSKMVFWVWNVDKNIFKMSSLRNTLLKRVEEKTYEL